jgi:hypothetical protein
MNILNSLLYFLFHVDSEILCRYHCKSLLLSSRTGHFSHPVGPTEVQTTSGANNTLHIKLPRSQSMPEMLSIVPNTFLIPP